MPSRNAIQFASALIWAISSLSAVEVRAVGPFDLALLLGSWGPCQEDCQADFNGDGVVGPFDLAQLLGTWGECP